MPRRSLLGPSARGGTTAGRCAAGLSYARCSGTARGNRSTAWRWCNSRRCGRYLPRGWPPRHLRHTRDRAAPHRLPVPSRQGRSVSVERCPAVVAGVEEGCCAACAALQRTGTPPPQHVPSRMCPAAPGWRPLRRALASTQAQPALLCGGSLLPHRSLSQSRHNARQPGSQRPLQLLLRISLQLLLRSPLQRLLRTCAPHAGV